MGSFCIDCGEVMTDAATNATTDTVLPAANTFAPRGGHTRGQHVAASLPQLCCSAAEMAAIRKYSNESVQGYTMWILGPQEGLSDVITSSVYGAPVQQQVQAVL